MSVDAAGAAEMQDTIAAIATPPGTGGISVIRISGPASIELAAQVFSQPTTLLQAPGHTLHHGDILDEEQRVVDNVLIAVFRAPSSYTGEDCTEISCHGGVVVTRAVLERMFRVGARPAEPGEFTRRAFLNGKLDLSQAEAVADLIHAQSEQAHRAAADQLQGRLATFVVPIRERLLHAISMLELGLDFVEEDVEFLDRAEVETMLRDTEQELHAALESYRNGRLIREGFRVALTGAPNVGKSSLLNAILGTDRAIVTEIPGTTRDYLEESRLIDGMLFRFVDTAGLRATTDPVEQQGIERTRAQQEQADLVLRLYDARDGYLADDASIDNVLSVYNKADLLGGHAASVFEGMPVILVSAKLGQGIDRLTGTLAEHARSQEASSEAGGVMVTNARHAERLRSGLAAVRAALAAAAEGLSEEFIVQELRGAAEALGEIIGAVSSDDVLNSIFSRFCIGK